MPPFIKHLLITLTAASAFCGCRRTDQTTSHLPQHTPTTRPQDSEPPFTQLTAATPAQLNQEIQRRGSLTFRSWNGKWIGMDADTDLTFLPDGKAHMFEYGYNVTAYIGAYQIAGDGTVTMQFPTFGHPWPTMTLQQDRRSLLLLPASSTHPLVMGNRAGATFAAGQGTYWPFRPVTPADELGIRERMDK